MELISEFESSCTIENCRDTISNCTIHYMKNYNSEEIDHCIKENISAFIMKFE